MAVTRFDHHIHGNELFLTLEHYLSSPSINHHHCRPIDVNDIVLYYMEAPVLYYMGAPGQVS